MVAAMKKSFFVYFSFVLLIASSFSLLANDQDWVSVLGEKFLNGSCESNIDFYDPVILIKLHPNPHQHPLIENSTGGSFKKR